MSQTTNSAGLELIKSFESCSLKAYKLSGESYYTIGWGHSFDSSITASTVWTQSKADSQLKTDLKKYEAYVEKYVPIKMTDNMFSALVSYTYNRGLGGLKQLISNSKTASDYATNIVVYWGSATAYKTGLVRRRKAEKVLFETKMHLVPTSTVSSSSDELYIRYVQKKLNKLCTYCSTNKLTVDGTWGAKSDKALVKYWGQLGWNVKDADSNGYHKIGTKTITAFKSNKTK